MSCPESADSGDSRLAKDLTLMNSSFVDAQQRLDVNFDYVQESFHAILFRVDSIAQYSMTVKLGRRDSGYLQMATACICVIFVAMLRRTVGSDRVVTYSRTQEGSTYTNLPKTRIRACSLCHML